MNPCFQQGACLLCGFVRMRDNELQTDMKSLSKLHEICVSVPVSMR